MLRQQGHECWTASDVGLATAADDELTVWVASHKPVLVSSDAEFGRRRKRNATGHHVWLKCRDWDASSVLEQHLPDVIVRLATRTDLTVQVSPDSVSDSSDWR